MDRKANARSILIVEDGDVARRALESILRRRGWKVSSVATVAEALASLDPPPDCILLDLMLPDGDGEEVIRKAREENLPTRVIVATGCQDPARLAVVEGLGAQALLRKPLDFSEILMRFW